MKFILLYLTFLFPVGLLAQEKLNEFEELANSYQNKENFALAAEYYGKAGYAYWNKGNFARAALTFQKAYDFFLQKGNTNACITLGNNLGVIYLSDEKYDNAYTVFSNVLAMARKSKNKTETLNALLNLATVAYELKSYNDAVSKASEALSLSKEDNNLRLIAKSYSILAESNEKMGNTSEAFKYFELYSSIDKRLKSIEMEDVKQTSAIEVNKAQEKKRVTEIELKIKTGELKLTQDSLYVSERLAYERQMQVELRNELLKKKEIRLRYELKLRNNLIIGIIITALFLFILGFLLRQKLKDNKTLRKQKEEITEQRNKLDVQNKKITDSIHYGLRIQQAMLPNIEEIKNIFDAFVIFKPKDIVSGDFYWFHESQEFDGITYRFIAVVDCTGHGVPGAFMSMIGHRLITETVIERNINQPSRVLEEINKKLKIELDQENKKSMDGMDIAFCRLSVKEGKYNNLVFAGAKRPMLVYRKNEKQLTFLEGNKKSIGGYREDESKVFSDKTMDISDGDMVFLYSDGIIDQPNHARERFGTEKLTAIINKNIDIPMQGLKETIEKAFDTHKTSEDQRDDITIIGLRLN